jgi:hypothetical protein
VNTVEAIGSGLAGACALTLIHESARHLVPEAPRADILGKRVIKKVMRALQQKPPAERHLHKVSLGGDIIFNTLYYSLVGLGGREQAWSCGAALGALAGIGAVVLPGPLGLGKGPSARTPATAAMTIGWYLAGGLAAAGVYRLLSANDD